jgi:hypothetical protein
MIDTTAYNHGATLVFAGLPAQAYGWPQNVHLTT